MEPASRTSKAPTRAGRAARSVITWQPQVPTRPLGRPAAAGAKRGRSCTPTVGAGRRGGTVPGCQNCRKQIADDGICDEQA